jgi:MFS transporter, DHA1 family, tetracycline resistance protein
MAAAGLAQRGWLYLGSIPIISLWNISMPAAQGIMTRRVSEREQGELQGAIGSVRSLAFVIGPGLFSWTFAFFINPKHRLNLPGAAFFLAAALLFSACLLSTRIEKTRETDAEPRLPSPELIPPEGISSATISPSSESDG